MEDEEPQRDKFESLRTDLSSAVSVAEGGSHAPKRDKFASLTLREQEQSSPPASVPAHEPANDSSILSAEISKPPRRDKFASMAARKELTAEAAMTAAARAPSASKNRDNATPTSRLTPRDKFSSTTQLQKSHFVDRTNAEKNSGSNGRVNFEIRTQQRLRVLEDLEIAETHTWMLIQFASRTAEHLAKLNVEQSDTTVSSISLQYRDTLQKIHSLLSRHSKFVKAYENHQEEVDATNMYAARVETRLAQERRNVVEELLKLEKQELPLGVTAGIENKRKRDD
ncbi:hypothetical protein MHU86_24521 [Fragilaria crotonensis]|nr:hypothetical protein MHU86_24521 [Fragilaria crotonensis]